MSEVVKGKVTVKVHGMLKQKQLSGNWAVLYDGEGKNDRPPCLELYNENDQSSPVHTISLEHLKFPDKSYRQQEAFLVLSIKKEKHQFQFEDVESKEEWVQSFCHVSQDLWKQWASGRESSEIESDSVTDMSDNLLYDSFSKAPEFKVSINPTQLSEANNLKGHYMVSPTQASLRLTEIDSPTCKHEWLYRQIRKYGSTRKIFRLEVGRGCTTGPGELEFFTLDGRRLSELIAMYTRQTFNQDHKQMFNQEQKSPQAKGASPTPENDNHVESQTSMVQTTSDLNSQQAAGNPQRTSELKESTKGKESRNSQGGSTGSLDSKRDAPIPVPRSSVNKPRKETSSANGVGETAHSSDDKKIYQTSSGLTAPLNSQLKHELHSKLHVQPDPAQSHSAEIEDDPTSDSVENISSRGSSESIKDKRKSDKERKKLEKEQKATEAKRKKQQEKEQKEREKELKEQREREAKEEKERQKKMKKESKVREKLKGKKSLDIPASAPAQYPDGNIYDEPGELLHDHPPSHEPESGYCEAGDFIPALQQPLESAAGAQAAAPDEYAIPLKPKDSWKTRARPESQQIHQENYAAIKQASQSQSRRSRPPVAPQPSLPAEDGDETYNRLGDVHPSALASENIYGMASAKDTIQAESAAVVENE